MAVPYGTTPVQSRGPGQGQGGIKTYDFSKGGVTQKGRRNKRRHSLSDHAATSDVSLSQLVLLAEKELEVTVVASPTPTAAMSNSKAGSAGRVDKEENKETDAVDADNQQEGHLLRSQSVAQSSDLKSSGGPMRSRNSVGVASTTVIFHGGPGSDTNLVLDRRRREAEQLQKLRSLRDQVTVADSLSAAPNTAAAAGIDIHELYSSQLVNRVPVAPLTERAGMRTSGVFSPPLHHSISAFELEEVNTRELQDFRPHLLSPAIPGHHYFGSPTAGDTPARRNPYTPPLSSSTSPARWRLKAQSASTPSLRPGVSFAPSVRLATSPLPSPTATETTTSPINMKTTIKWQQQAALPRSIMPDRHRVSPPAARKRREEESKQKAEPTGDVLVTPMRQPRSKAALPTVQPSVGRQIVAISRVLSKANPNIAPVPECVDDARKAAKERLLAREKARISKDIARQRIDSLRERLTGRKGHASKAKHGKDDASGSLSSSRAAGDTSSHSGSYLKLTSRSRRVSALDANSGRETDRSNKKQNISRKQRANPADKPLRVLPRSTSVRRVEDSRRHASIHKSENDDDGNYDTDSVDSDFSLATDSTRAGSHASIDRTLRPSQRQAQDSAKTLEHVENIVVPQGNLEVIIRGRSCDTNDLLKPGIAATALGQLRVKYASIFGRAVAPAPVHVNIPRQERPSLRPTTLSELTKQGSVRSAIHDAALADATATAGSRAERRLIGTSEKLRMASAVNLMATVDSKEVVLRNLHANLQASGKDGGRAGDTPAGPAEKQPLRTVVFPSPFLTPISERQPGQYADIETGKRKETVARDPMAMVDAYYEWRVERNRKLFGLKESDYVAALKLGDAGRTENKPQRSASISSRLKLHGIHAAIMAKLGTGN